jgi:gas vesicle protein
MKTKILTFAVVGCMTGLLFAGCDKTSEQKVEAANQELKEAKADYTAEWQKFKTESEAQIKVNEDKIDAYKEKMDKAGHKAKANYKKAVAELKEKNHALKEKLEEYKDDGESKWQEFKRNFSNDLDAVGKTVSDLFTDKD